MSPGEPLPNKRPVSLAAAFLQQTGWAEVHWEMNAGTECPEIQPTKLRHWREEFYVFETNVYRKVLLEELEGRLVPFLNAQKVWMGDGDKAYLRPLHVDAATINNVLRTLRAFTQAPCDTMPAWLDGGKDRPNPKEVIAFTNGLLDVETWLADPAELPSAPTPVWFSQAVLPRAYDPDAVCPRTVEYFYDALADDDQVNLLQEWLGYSLTRETRFQKMLWLHGFGGAGKGTMAKLMTELVGQANAVSFGLFDLTERFTLSSFVGKTLAVSHDAHLGQSSDAQKVIEHVLAIAGEDDRNIDRKNRELLPNVRLGTRLVVAVNGFPHLPDAGIALRRRSLVLSFGKSFSSNPDPYLFDKLRVELPGLTVWAMEGLRRLYARGGFPTTKRCEDLLDRLGRLSSPVRSFLDDCCVVDEEGAEVTSRVLKRHVFRAWQEWAKANGHRPMANNTFCEKLYEASPVIRGRRAGSARQRIRVIDGLSLTDEALRLIPEGEQATSFEEQQVLEGTEVETQAT